MPFNFYSKIFFVCAMFFLSSIFLSSSVEARKICHNNYATIHFYNYKDGASWPVTTLNSATPSMLFWVTSDGQSCGGPAGMIGWGWNYRADTEREDSSLGYTDVKNKLKLLYHCGRHKTELVSKDFMHYSNSNPVLGLDLYGDVSNNANYMPHKMNFMMNVSLKNLPIFKDPTNKKDVMYVKIPELIFGQSSEGGIHFKTIFDISAALAETAAYAAGGSDDSPSINKMLLQSYNRVSQDLAHLHAHKNNWYVSQASAQDGTRTAYMTEFLGKQAFVAYAEDELTSKRYPIFITPGKDEHHFDAYIVTDTTEKAPKEGSLEASPHIGNNHFLHASLGPFKRYAGSRWIESTILGWLYPEEYDSEDDWRWIYRRESDSWILIHRQAPQYIYRELANRIFRYDQQNMKFVVDREAWDSSEKPPGLPPKPEKPEDFDPTSLK